MFNKDKTNLIFLFALILIVIVVMLPFREETSGDDYAYALTVKHFVQTGNFQLSQATAAALVFLAVWGSLFSKVFGFSLKTLHLSVVVFLPILSAAVYFLLREFKLERTKSFFATILFISTPFIFQYAYSFFTDIPFLTLEVLSIIFYTKAFKENNHAKFFLGSLFSSLAFLTRQIGIFLCVSALVTFLLFLLWRNRQTSISNTFKYLFSICAPAAVTIVLYLIFFREPTIGQASFFQNVVLANLSSLFSIHAPVMSRINAWAQLYYRLIEFFWLAMGLFSPLTIIILSSNIKEFLRTKLLKGALTSLIIFIILIALELILFPGKVYLGFPLVLYRYEIFPIPWPHIWKYLVLASFLFLGTCVSINIKKIDKGFLQSKLNKIFFFILLSFLLILGSTLLAVLYYPKYVIPLLPFYLIFFANLSKKIKLYVPIAILVTAIVFLDSLQMAKLRYDENGLAQAKAVELKNQGIAAERILPNLEYTWSLWFDVDAKLSEELKRVNGNKKKAMYPQTPSSQDYIIISKEHLKYEKLQPDYRLIGIMPFRSLFASSYLLVIKK